MFCGAGDTGVALRFPAGIPSVPTDRTFAGIEQALDVKDEPHRSYQGKCSDAGRRKGLAKTDGCRDERPAFGNDIVDKDNVRSLARRWDDRQGPIVLLYSRPLPHPGGRRLFDRTDPPE